MGAKERHGREATRDGAGWSLVNGHLTPADQAVVPATDLGLLRGWSVFETLSWPDSHLAPHLARLSRSCEAAGLTMPDSELLSREIREVGARTPPPASVRVTLTASGNRIVTAQPVSLARRNAPVRCARGPHVDDPFVPGSVKHGSRMGWEVAVQRAGVDDVLRVSDGRFTEGTRSGVLAVIDGVLYTAPHDGRILASTTVTRLTRHAAALGITVRREGPPADGPWDALYIASSTRGLAPVVELDGEPLAGFDPIGRRLARRDLEDDDGHDA